MIAAVISLIGVLYAFNGSPSNVVTLDRVTELMTLCIQNNVDPGPQRDCTDEVYRSTVDRIGLRGVAEAHLRAVQSAGKRGALTCHNTSERFGELYALDKGEAALNDLVYSCLGGPVHGVFYTLGKTRTADEMAKLGRGVCENFGVNRSWTIGWDCRHGIGHAIGLDPNVDPLHAFQLCAEVYETEDYREDCASGVVSSLYNETVENESANHEANGYDANDPGRWCEKNLQGGLMLGCITRAGLILSMKPNISLAEWAALCDNGDQNCMYGIGFGAGNPISDLAPVDRVAVCAQFESADAKACMAGLVRHMFPDYYLAGTSTGVCDVAGEMRALCLQEEDRMRRREFTVAELVAQKTYGRPGETDPAKWPHPLGK